MSGTEKQESKSEECHDLSNLKYKTLLENGKKMHFLHINVVMLQK